MKKKTLPHFPFYPSDFVSKTVRLTDAEVGAYMRLLCEQWTTGDIPLVTTHDGTHDARVLRMICESAETSWPAIEKYFEQVGSGMKNPRMEKVRLKAEEIYSKRVMAGKASAESRATSVITHDPTSVDLTQNSKHITKKTEPTTQSSGVLRAHEAFSKISTKKPSQHETLQITNLCHQYTSQVVVTAIEVMGDHSWHSVGTLKKVLGGELPKKDVKGKVDVYKNPGKDQYEEL